MKDPIFPFSTISKEKKELLLNQPGIVFWLTGLSGSGKSTISKAMEGILHKQGYLVKVLDGDNIRQNLCSDLGFSKADRIENIRRISEVAKLFVENGQIVICSFISPFDENRKSAEKIIGDKYFRLIYVNTPLEVCIRRDTKGLYKKAKLGQIKEFTGVSSPYEEPKQADLEINGDEKIEETLNKTETFMLNTIQQMQLNR